MIGSSKMSTFSVYNYSTKKFDYYEHPTPHVDLGSVKFSSYRKPTNFRSNNHLGTVAETTAPHLPPGARVVGSGFAPRGVIATTSQQLSKLSGGGLGDGLTSDTGRVFMFTAVAITALVFGPKIISALTKTFA